MALVKGLVERLPHSLANFFSSPTTTTPSYRGTEQVRRRQDGSGSMDPATMSVVVNKGLTNKPGQNNCFLNAAVQVLWHTDVFRRSFRQFEGHSCLGSTCIFCALKTLFTHYGHAEQSAIPPDILRNAMANCYESEHRFQLGLMDDAAECFEKLLEQVHFHLTGSMDMDSCSRPYCISHKKFALSFVEQTNCSCGATSEPLPFIQFVHYVSATVIAEEYDNLRAKMQPGSPGPDQYLFDWCVQIAGSTGESGHCPQDPMCRQRADFKRVLLNEPDVVCLGLIWDSDVPPVSHIMKVFEAIRLILHPVKAFDYVASERLRDTDYHLTAMITYYGRHYSTFCYHSVKKTWIYFDDARFRTIGTDWSLVVEECRKAHYQPLLLIYTNPNGSIVDISAAPTETVMVAAASDLCSSSSAATPPDTKLSSHSPVKDIRPCNLADATKKLPDKSGLANDPKAMVAAGLEKNQVEDLISFSLAPAVLGMQSNTTTIPQAHQTNVARPVYTMATPHTTSANAQSTATKYPQQWEKFSSSASADARSNPLATSPSLYPKLQSYPPPPPAAAAAHGATKTLHDYNIQATNNYTIDKRNALAKGTPRSPSPHRSPSPNSTRLSPSPTPVNTTHQLPSLSPSSSPRPQHRQFEGNLKTELTTIPRIQQEALQDIETCWITAESASQRGDPTACLLYVQAAEMLHKLLNDPIIKSRLTLYRLLSKRKAEAQHASHHLRESMLKARKNLSPDMKIFSDERAAVNTASSAAAVGSCRICREHRELNTRGMCGPCNLKQNLQTRA